MEKDVVIYIIGGLLTVFLAIIGWLMNKIFQLLKDVFDNFKTRLDSTDERVDEISDKVNDLKFIHETICPVQTLRR